MNQAQQEFNQFRSQLAGRIQEARTKGVSEKVLLEGIVNLAEVAMRWEQPGTKEEALLTELWKTANEDEKRTLAKILVRMGENSTRTH